MTENWWYSRRSTRHRPPSEPWRGEDSIEVDPVAEAIAATFSLKDPGARNECRSAASRLYGSRSLHLA